MSNDLVCVTTPEPESDRPRLSMMAYFSIYGNGCSAPQCAWCGKFRKESDFYGAKTGAIGGGVCIDFAPKCKTCRDKEAPDA